jgi:hypothetical protein
MQVSMAKTLHSVLILRWACEIENISSSTYEIQAVWDKGYLMSITARSRSRYCKEKMCYIAWNFDSDEELIFSIYRCISLGRMYVVYHSIITLYFDS